MENKISKIIYSLKFRLMFLITISLVFVVGLPVGIFVRQLDKNYNDFSINMIETTSQVVYQFIFDAMMKNDSLAIQKNLKLLSLEPTIQLIRIYRPNGEIIYSSIEKEVKQAMDNLSEDVHFFKKMTGEIEAFKRIGNLYSHHHPIYIQKECLPCHQNVGELIAVLDVHAGYTQSEQMYQSSKNLAILGGLVIVVILWIFLNLIFQSQVEAKLKTIVSGFEKLSKNKFDFSIKTKGKDELSFVAKKFNEMIRHLKISRQKEEQFFLEKLERADRLITLGEVAAEIAHEVNNPAGIILTRAEFLKDEMHDINPGSTCKEDLDIIISQTEKIAETTRSILHYARKLPKTFSQTDLKEVIEHAIKVLQPRIRKKNVKIEMDLLRDEIFVWGSFNQLEQVFCNLINNSLDVLDKNEKNIKIIVNNKPGSVTNIIEIIFQDNGPGIPREFAGKIFNPFFTTKGNEKGTGLGLFIVKNIVLNHNGSIKLDKTFSKGACFVVHLEAYHGKS